tara:strand:- start:294 stop:488 length:195 start_codon:yes stop_codon:yes gene_type:complete
MPKVSVYIREENLKKWETLTEKSAWINNILNSWSITDLNKLKKKNSYSRLEKRVARLERMMKNE